MKKTYLLLILICIASGGYAQVASLYSFTGASTTFTSISASGTAATILCDDCTQTGIPIGFTFTFAGADYTLLSATSNGALSLSNTVSLPATNLAANIPSAGFLMPFWDDLTGLTGSGTTGAYYRTNGSAPNRVFTFEWKEFMRQGGSSPFNIVAQVKLYETTNVVEFIYGSSSLVANSGTIGIANSTTDWQTLDNALSTATPSSSTFTADFVEAPGDGQIYRWTPGCNGTPTAGSVSPSVTAGCVSYSSVLSLSGATTGTGIAYQWQSSLDGSAWTDVTGAVSATYTATVTGTIYYRCKLTCVFSGLNATTSSVTLFFNEPAPIMGLDTVCVGSAITLTDISAGGTWSTGGAFASISASGVVTGVSTGLAVITYTHAGCPATKQVYVSPCIINGVKTVAEKGVTTLQVYPNPSSGTFTINLSSGINEPAQIIINDLLGRQLRKFTVTTNAPIELKSDIPAGVYVITAGTSGGNYVTKLMIE